MQKLDYSQYQSGNTDIAFSSDNGYTNDPGSELETRKQLSYPLKEIKDFLGKAIPVNSSDNVVQLVVSSTDTLQYRNEPNGTLHDITGGIPSGGTTGQVLRKVSNSDFAVDWETIDNEVFSFIGMVVQGTNLATEADVKAIYGAYTSWRLISSVFAVTNNVFGNGKTFPLAVGTGSEDKILTFRGNGTSLSWGEGYGDDMGTVKETGASDGTTRKVMGAPTKTQLGEHPEYSGLIIDTMTVYSWERTA